MAVDKGYGSGKPRGRGNSVARARVASKRYSKGKKNPEFNLVTKAGEVADYIISGPKETRGKYLEVGVSPLKLASVAKALFKAGKQSQALSVADRVLVKNTGRALGVSKGIGRSQPMGNYTMGGKTIENLQDIRAITRDVFPKRPGPGKQPGRILQKQASKNTVIVPRAAANARLQKFAKANMTAGEKYRASLGGKVTRVAELEKRLNFPKRGR